MSISNKLTLKVTYENETRRFQLEKPSFAILLSKLTELFRIKSDNFIIQYKDDEQDDILLSSDEELHEAFHLAYSQTPAILRLHITTNLKYQNTPHNPSLLIPHCNLASGGWFERCMEKGKRTFHWHTLSHHINHLFKTGSLDDLEKARALLLEQSELDPSHPVPLYNLACVESLLGNFQPSLDYLEKSIHLGWNDLAHMQQDTDLDALRHFDHYQYLVSILETRSVTSPFRVLEPMRVHESATVSSPIQQEPPILPSPILAQVQNESATVSSPIQQEPSTFHSPILSKEHWNVPVQHFEEPFTVRKDDFQYQPSFTFPVECKQREEIFDELEGKLLMLSEMGFSDGKKWFLRWKVLEEMYTLCQFC